MSMYGEVSEKNTNLSKIREVRDAECTVGSVFEVAVQVERD